MPTLALALFGELASNATWQDVALSLLNVAQTVLLAYLAVRSRRDANGSKSGPSR